MILGFRKNDDKGKPTGFKQKILDGVKIHTIRLDQHQRWQPGNKIHMATGIRTQYYDQFNKDRPDLQACKAVQGIEIRIVKMFEIQELVHAEYAASVMVDGEIVPISTVATNDGFDTVPEFIKWFYPLCDLAEDDTFRGRLIHWTNLKY